MIFGKKSDKPNMPANPPVPSGPKIAPLTNPRMSREIYDFRVDLVKRFIKQFGDAIDADGGVIRLLELDVTQGSIRAQISGSCLSCGGTSETFNKAFFQGLQKFAQFLKPDQIALDFDTTVSQTESSKQGRGAWRPRGATAPIGAPMPPPSPGTRSVLAMDAGALSPSEGADNSPSSGGHGHGGSGYGQGGPGSGGYGSGKSGGFGGFGL